MAVIDVVLDVLPVIISSVALVVAVISGRRQWRSARNANAVAAVLKLFEEYRTDELRSARRAVFQMEKFPVGAAPALRDLSDDLRAPSERVAQYFDHVGLLVGHRLVPARPMISFFGFGCTALWKKLEPCIIAERELRGVGYYLGYFEGFAALSEKIDADELNRNVTIHMRSGRMRLE